MAIEVTASSAITASTKRRSRAQWLLLVFPAVAFLFAFFLYPLLFVVGRSAQGLDFSNYINIVTIPVYLRVIGLTFETSAIVTIACLLLAYPYAYAMARSKGWKFNVLSVCLLLPFWVSLLLRTFAWIVLLQDTGLINSLLIKAGLISDPLPLIRNTFGVGIGMTHILLPYAVLPIYSVMLKIDPKLMEASAILGARPLRSFIRVFLPLSMPGVLAAALLTFTLGLGFYITPALLGGARNTMIAQLIADQVNQQLNFGFGSALAVTLLALTALAFVALGLFVRMSRNRVSARAA